MRLFLFIIILSCDFAESSAQENPFEVNVTGKGEPVLLFPGFSCTGEVWNETVEELSKTHECHVFTFAGFGDVPPIEMPWLSTIKDSITAYVEKNDLNKPVIIGHSMGGTLGLWLASEKTEMFKKVIGIDALPSVGALMVPEFNPETMVYDNPYSQQMLEMDEKSFKAMAEQQSSFMVLNKEKVDLITGWILMADRKTYVNGYVDLLKLDIREDIALIQIPVIVLAAGFPDKELIKTTFNSQYEKLPATEFHYFDNSAHFIMYDQPRKFIEKIKQILD